MNIMLFKAIDRATLTICNGYEIDVVFDDGEAGGKQWKVLYCGEDLIAMVEDQNVYVNEDGQVFEVKGIQDALLPGAAETCDFEFRVYRALEEKDFLSKDLL